MLLCIYRPGTLMIMDKMLFYSGPGMSFSLKHDSAAIVSEYFFLFIYGYMGSACQCIEFVQYAKFILMNSAGSEQNKFHMRF